MHRVAGLQGRGHAGPHHYLAVYLPHQATSTVYLPSPGDLRCLPPLTRRTSRASSSARAALTASASRRLAARDRRSTRACQGERWRHEGWSSIRGCTIARHGAIWGVLRHHHTHTMRHEPCTHAMRRAHAMHARLHEHEYQVLPSLRLALRVHARALPLLTSPLPLLISPLLLKLRMQRSPPGVHPGRRLDRAPPCHLQPCHLPPRPLSSCGEALSPSAPCARTS